MSWTKEMKNFHQSHRSIRQNLNPVEIETKLTNMLKIENPTQDQNIAMTIYALVLLRRANKDKIAYRGLENAFAALKKAGHPDNDHVKSYFSAIQKELKRSNNGEESYPTKAYTDRRATELDNAYRVAGFTYPKSMTAKDVCPSIQNKFSH